MKTKRCLVCAEAFDMQTPAIGMPPKATPDAGDLAVCGGCGLLYQIGEDGEPHRTDLARFVNMDPKQKAQLEAMQEHFRGRAQIQPPADYTNTVVRAEKMLLGWLARRANRPRPLFRLPHPDILLAAELRPLVPRIGGNAAARELLAYLVRMEPGLTVFMVRVLVSGKENAIDVETVPLTDLGIEVGTS
jgi:hypothetical protein